MWILFARAPKADAAYWPGRRWLAALDAIAWPALWVAFVAGASIETGILGRAVIAVAIVSLASRLHRALWRNERYQFTTWRWAVPFMKLALIVWIIKVLA